MTDLNGKRALVTGGSRGIGAGIALALADAGADVAITYERAADRAEQIVRRIEQKGRKAVAIQADGADPAAVKRSVEETVAALGGLDILVGNAGIARMGPFAELSLADLDALLDVNVRAPMLAAQAAIPHLTAGGRIITIGSNVANRVPFGGITAYAMSKSALLSFTRGLARELGPQDITVNLVQPGPIETEMNPSDSPFAEQVRGLTALGRYGLPEDIGAAVAFLASPAARNITGASFDVDGGFNA